MRKVTMNRYRQIITAFFMLLLLTLLPLPTQAAEKKEVRITIAKNESSMWADSTRKITVKTSVPSVISYKTSDKRIVYAKDGRLYASKPGRAVITIIAKPKSAKYQASEKKLIMNIIPVPSKPDKPALKRSGTKVEAAVKKVKYAAGYQFRYATDSSMKGAETITAAVPSCRFPASETKNYYVKVRSYTKANGRTFYSDWSSAGEIKGNPPKPVEPPETGIPQTKAPVIAHRGASNLAPENTLPAFELAAQNGFTALECDVRETKDGFLVVSHDDSLQKSCGVNLLISELTLEEIRSYNVIAGSNAAKYPENKIPTFSEFLNVCNQYGCTPVIELKLPISNAGLDKLYSMLSVSVKKPVVISFISELLIYLRKLDADLELQKISHRWDKMLLEECREYNLDMSISRKYLSQTAIIETHKAGLKIATWLVLNRNEIHMWDKMGVDYITCETNAVIP